MGLTLPLLIFLFLPTQRLFWQIVHTYEDALPSPRRQPNYRCHTRTLPSGSQEPIV
jgi:hypothetical protein